MMKRKFGVSLPEDVVNDIDAHAAYWGLDRSAMIVKIYREWAKAVQPLPKKNSKPKAEKLAIAA
jgi:metal-responsive CopG/Arc/MetJ family transcriptional regulator